MLRVPIAVAAVALSTAVLFAADADLTFAAVVLLLVVAATSVFGYAAGLSAAIASVAALTYYFTPPLHSFRIQEPDDILALVAFIAVSLLVGATIARLNELRARAEVHARESALRVTLTHELRRGIDVEIVLRRLATELSELFDLSECRITLDDTSIVDRDVLVDMPPVRIRAERTRALAPGDLGVIRGLVAAVATTIELERLDASAREDRLRRELDQSRAAVLTAFTHDLRTPLATIQAASGALMSPSCRLDDLERVELLEDVRSEAARLERLVDKVLEAGRVRSGSVQPDRVATAPIDLVQSLSARRVHALVHQHVEVVLDPDLPAVDVDPLLMDHVLTNLLENAALHGASARPIEVRGSTGGSRVQLAIVDHGAGIPATDRERVFDEFFRRRAPKDGDGTGLGLTIVRALVEAHDGRVWCEETAGGGATFVVELPVSKERNEA